MYSKWIRNGNNRRLFFIETNYKQKTCALDDCLEPSFVF